MSCAILTAERWQRFFDDRLTASEAVQLREHLATDCLACEQFFEAMDETTEERLFVALRALQPAGAPLPAESRAAFQAVMSQVSQARRQPRWRRWAEIMRGGKPLAAAWAGGVAVLVVGALYTQSVMAPVQTEKGAAPVPPFIRLEFAVGTRQADNTLMVTRGVLGEHYPSSARLFLRADIPANGHIYLLGYKSPQALSILYPENPATATPQPPGLHHIPADDAGLSLQGTEGLYIVVGVYSPTPLDPSSQLVPLVQHAVDPATGLVNQDAVDSAGEGIAVDAVYFDVQT